MCWLSQGLLIYVAFWLLTLKSKWIITGMASAVLSIFIFGTH